MDKLRKYALEDPDLEKYLLHHDVKESISIIEELLNQDSIKLKQLQAMRENNQRSQDKHILSKNLKDIAAPIYEEVNRFVKADSITTPDISYGGYFRFNKYTKNIYAYYLLSGLQIVPSTIYLYNNPSPLAMLAIFPILTGGVMFKAAVRQHNKYARPESANYTYQLEEITLTKEPRIVAIPIIAHEYTHHLQFKKLFSEEDLDSPHTMTNSDIFIEGHARGVQKEISRIYSEKEDNASIMYTSIDQSVGELKSTYIWMCERLPISINPKLLHMRTTRDERETEFRKTTQRPTPHAIGYTIFSICEAREGKEIYSRTLNNDFRFLKTNW